MLSTLTSYRRIATNYDTSLANKSSSSNEKREAQYFRDHIGAVNTIDDFFRDHRLYAFAMKAYGLEEMIPSKGFIRKVLTGEPDSSGRTLADRLQDSRYRDFAAAFDFKAYGDVPGAPATALGTAERPGSAQSLEQRRAAYDDDTSKKIDYVRLFAQNIETDKDIIEDIVADSAVSSFVRTTVGLAPAFEADDADTQALQIAGRFDAATFQDADRLDAFFDRFRTVRQAGRDALADAQARADYDRDTDRQIGRVRDFVGNLRTTQNIVKHIAADPVMSAFVRTAVGLRPAIDADTQAQQLAGKVDLATFRDADKLKQLLDQYRATRQVGRSLLADARAKADYDSVTDEQIDRVHDFADTLATEKNIFLDIVADSRLSSIVQMAAGLDPASPSDAADTQARQIAGKVDAATLQDPAKLDLLADRYRSARAAEGAAFTDAQVRVDFDSETDRQVDYLRAFVKDFSTERNVVKELVANPAVSAVVRAALGLDPGEDAEAQAQRIASKVDAATFQDPAKLEELVDLYRAARQAGRSAIVDPYYRTAGTYADSDAEGANLARYFRAKIGTIDSAADLVQDPTLTDIVRGTLGLPADLTSQSPTDQAKAIAAKLDVWTLRDPGTLNGFLDRFQSQRADARAAAIGAHAVQALEVDSGAENEGVRLALYFRRKAGTVASAYGILADRALAEVVRTAIGLPPEAARGSIDAQARLIERKVDLASLKDPASLDKFIKRFAVMWDMKNNPPVVPTLAIFGASGGGLSADLLMKLQNIRLGGR